MKNLRAILLLLKGHIPRPTRKAVDKLADAIKDHFSAQRDAFVVEQLRAKFDGRPSSTSEGTRISAADLRISTPKTKIAHLVELLSALELKGLTWDIVVRNYVKRYRTARKAMKACIADPDPDTFHQWRRPVKDLFYQSQLLQPLAGMKTRRELADRLADRLGKLNDLHMLRARAAKFRGNGFAKKLGKKSKDAESESLKLAAKLFAARPRELTREFERSLKFHPTLAAKAVRQT